MSLHVFVRRTSGPLNREEWTAAVAQLPALQLDRALDGAPAARLVADKRQWLIATPQGELCVQEPSLAMIEALFALAALLQAEVCSEGRRPYASTADWQQRRRRAQSSPRWGALLSQTAPSGKVFGIAVLVMALISLGLIGLEVWKG